MSVGGPVPYSLALAAVLAIVGGFRAAADEPPRSLLSRIADEKDPTRDAAIVEWKALTDADRVERVRQALRSEDPALAFVAAEVGNPMTLDLSEIHLQWKALSARDPLALHRPPAALKGVMDGRFSFGSPDLPAIWRAMAEVDPPGDGFYYASLHRALLSSQVADLVPLLETAKPTAFRGLLADLWNQAEGEAGDERQAVYVEAFRYGLARLRAEAAKKEIPSRASIPPAPPKAGLPAEFLELCDATWGAPGTGFDLGGWPDDPAKKEPPPKKPAPPGSKGPARWLARWAWRLTPSEEDVPFLLATTQSARAPWQAQVWAARKIAATEGRAAGRTLREVIEGGGEPALYAAAEAASRGRRDDWERLNPPRKVEERRPRDQLPPADRDTRPTARWLADPKAARDFAWKEMLAGERPTELEESERWFGEYDAGVAIPADALSWLADRLREGKANPAVQAWFFSKVLPEAMTVEDAKRIAQAFSEDAKPTEPLDTEVLEGLAAIEARAPEALLAMLRAWAKRVEDPDTRSSALAALARLGDTSLPAEMIARWKPVDMGRPPLGRVHHPDVEAFLRERAASADVEVETAAVRDLAVFYGCPEPLAEYLGENARKADDPKAAHADEAKALVLAKDPIGAVLARTAEGPYVGGGGDIAWTAGFGLTKDPRVLERVAAWRADRSLAFYWEATAILAMLGDEAAAAEWRAFLSEARTFLLDDLQESLLFTRNVDPEWVADWVSRLGENCCYAWHADEVIRKAFPTMPYEHAPGDAGRSRVGATRWFATHRGTFVWSRLLGGWVPGPQPK